jgi:rhamnulokinase
MKHLAIDIGAESGRGVLGWLEDGKLRIREIHRFANKPIEIEGSLRWDIDALIANVQQTVEMAGPDLQSIGVDTWAVDYVVLDENDKPINLPFHYRDRRTAGGMQRAFERTPEAEIYRQTGIQFLPFNTLYQLASTDPKTFTKAKLFLTIPDYINHVLTGGESKVCEFTNATTTQVFDPVKQDWARELLAQQGIPSHIFPEVVQPGTVLGTVKNSQTKVIAVASHDTGSAVAGIPFEAPNSAWISSGTWSILGIEVPNAIINEESRKANFTNEGGVANTYRFSKNVAGLWLIQQCRAAWGNQDSYADLMDLATNNGPADERIDPDDPLFFDPGDMPARINSKLHRPTQDKGKLIRIVIESLANKYAQVLNDAERLSGIKTEQIHIVGGGCQNRLLNQLTADACQRPVIAGPVEATALGNLAVQLVTSGELQSIAHARQVIRDSVELETFELCTTT